MNEEPKAVVFDAHTNQLTERELNSEEISVIKESKENREAIENQEIAKKISRESALAKLAALGLTEEEIAAL